MPRLIRKASKKASRKTSKHLQGRKVSKTARCKTSKKAGRKLSHKKQSKNLKSRNLRKTSKKYIKKHTGGGYCTEPNSPAEIKAICNKLGVANTAEQFLAAFKEVKNILKSKLVRPGEKRPDDEESTTLNRAEETMTYYLTDSKAVVNKGNIATLMKAFEDRTNPYYVTNVFDLRNYFVRILTKLKAAS